MSTAWCSKEGLVVSWWNSLKAWHTTILRATEPTVVIPTLWIASFLSRHHFVSLQLCHVLSDVITCITALSGHRRVSPMLQQRYYLLWCQLALPIRIAWPLSRHLCCLYFLRRRRPLRPILSPTLIVWHWHGTIVFAVMLVSSCDLMAGPFFANNVLIAKNRWSILSAMKSAIYLLSFRFRHAVWLLSRIRIPQEHHIFVFSIAIAVVPLFNGLTNAPSPMRCSWPDFPVVTSASTKFDVTASDHCYWSNGFNYLSLSPEVLLVPTGPANSLAKASHMGAYSSANFAPANSPWLSANQPQSANIFGFPTSASTTAHDTVIIIGSTAPYLTQLLGSMDVLS